MGYEVSDLIKKFEESPVALIEEKRVIDMSELENFFSKARKVIVCDAYVNGIENIKGVFNEEFGFMVNDGSIVIIDHHAPAKKFSRIVSSTNLAVKYVKENGIIVDKNTVIVINHTDADSILSSMIVRGILSPEKMFEKAAIVADHTDEENRIADLLQALKHERDIKLSLRNLQLLLEGKALEPRAVELLEKRHKERQEAKKIVDSGMFKEVGGVVYAQLDKNINSIFWTALLPDAQIILTYVPNQKDSSSFFARTRVGRNFYGIVSLNEIGINDFDPEWGGRWNAGSNRRGGGTKLPIEGYASLLNGKLEECLSL